MARKTTNELIDTITSVIETFDFSNFGMDDVENKIREDRASQEWIEVLAREITRTVR